MMHRNTRLLSLVLLVVACAACQRTRPVAVPPAKAVAPPDTIPALPGVDHALARKADSLARGVLVSAPARAEGLRQAEAGLQLVRLADSLLQGERQSDGAAAETDSVGPERKRVALRAYNEGAKALSDFAEATDSTRAAILLDEAATRFAAALEANPFDQEAHYWLARVYELQADALGRAGATQAAIAVLQQLVAMQGHRPDYLALLAQAHERVDTPEAGLAAGALWRRAAQATIDDAALDPEGHIAVDSAAVFAHFARSNRALVQADRSDWALEALNEADDWATPSDDKTYLDAERRWILCDDGNLATRMRFDVLISQGASDPEGAARGLEALIPEVRRQHARLDVEHELARILYRIGREEAAVERMRQVFDDARTVPQADVEGMREDYGIMTYNLGMAHRTAGSLRKALGYLLQSEATGFNQSARAALQVSRLLSNNLAAAIDAGLRAEAGLAQLPAAEQKALLHHPVELYRRSGDRERAQAYVDKWRQLR